jgi:hypothetical protein
VFARVASFSGGSTEKLRQLSEEAMSAGTMDVPAGVTKAMVLSNEAGDRRLFLTFFDDRASLDAAEEQFDRMGDDIPEDVRGRRTAVDVYEVVFER